MSAAFDSARAPTAVNLLENGVWTQIQGNWIHLYGSFLELGVSVEWHDFQLRDTLDWSASFHSNSLEICLNFHGEGEFGNGKTLSACPPGKVAAYDTPDAPLPARRIPGAPHRFLTFEFSAPYLLRQFDGVQDGLFPSVRLFLDGKRRPPALLALDGIPAHLLLLRRQLIDPPVSAAARALWFESKITELLCSVLFLPNTTTELFCKRHQRQNREIAERILFLLDRDMANPPRLEDLARELGRSPFALSRIFSEVTGETIPAALRRLRIERAARLLRDTAKPVTEIAFEVGYSSLGAFNKAFLERYARPPGRFRTGDGDFCD